VQGFSVYGRRRLTSWVHPKQSGQFCSFARLSPSSPSWPCLAAGSRRHLRGLHSVSGDDENRCVTLLGAVLSLHDVADVEALAERALREQLRSLGARLRPEQREDCLTYLIGAAWELSERYDERRGRFSTFLYRTLRLRTVDWYRLEFGRTVWRHADYVYERERPLFSFPSSPEWTNLSERGEAILRQIEAPILLGFSPADVSATLGISRSCVSALRAELHDEPQRQLEA
jgi:hypothetical protein